jgi:hypothetical protein
MKQAPTSRALGTALAQFLTPQVWKQAHQAWRCAYAPPRWTLQPLVWVLLSLTWCTGQSQEERFAAACAVYQPRNCTRCGHRQAVP